VSAAVAFVVAEPTQWWLFAMIVIILSLAVYGLARVIQDIRAAWHEWHRDRSMCLDLSHVYVTQTGMTHIRKCSAYRSATQSKIRESLISKHCQRDFDKELRLQFKKENG
jgi:hypothetical protein